MVLMLHSFCIISVTNYPSGELCLGFPLKGEIRERCEALSDSYTKLTLSLIQILFLKGVFLVVFRQSPNPTAADTTLLLRCVTEQLFF